MYLPFLAVGWQKLSGTECSQINDLLRAQYDMVKIKSVCTWRLWVNDLLNSYTSSWIYIWNWTIKKYVRGEKWCFTIFSNRHVYFGCSRCMLHVLWIFVLMFSLPLSNDKFQRRPHAISWFGNPFIFDLYVCMCMYVCLYVCMAKPSR